MITLDELYQQKNKIIKKQTATQKFLQEFELLVEKYSIETSEMDLIESLFDEANEENHYQSYDIGQEELKETITTNLDSVIDRVQELIDDQIEHLTTEYIPKLTSKDKIFINKISNNINEILLENFNTDSLC